MKKISSFVKALAVLILLVVGLCGIGGLWCRHEESITRSEAVKLMEQAKTGKFTETTKGFAPIFQKRDKEVGPIQSYKVTGTYSGPVGAPVTVAFEVIRNGKKYSEGMYSDSPPYIEQFDSFDEK